MALRLPWFVSAGAGVLLMVDAVPRLTTAKMDAARSAAVPAAVESPRNGD